MDILFFGTYDEVSHPRVRALREGCLAQGHRVAVCNRPIGVSTDERVRAVRRPWLAPALGWRVLRSWWALWRAGRRENPDVVVVGYLGHLDVHLARRRFREATLVLDHMVSLGDTVRDRGLAPHLPVARLLDAVDRAALRAADIVVVDTEEQADALPLAPTLVVAVPVAAPEAWHRTAPAADPLPGEPLRVVFFGLYTPLQGAPTIGRALGMLASCASIETTMIGGGQDRSESQRLAADNPRVHWVDWADAEGLPSIVSAHHVCLGIFDTGPKAARVVPNKVHQGAAAGCAIITSDTTPQRRILGRAASYVPPGDAAALATELRRLADDPAELTRLRTAAIDRARRELSPAAAISPLLTVLEDRR